MGYAWHMHRHSRSEWIMTHPPARLCTSLRRSATAHGVEHPLQHIYVVLVPPGRGGQAWHVDSDTREFYTMLVQLQVADDGRGGGTQFRDSDESFADPVRPPMLAGDYCLFNGLVVHRGSTNRSAEPRLFLYATFYADEFHDVNHVG